MTIVELIKRDHDDVADLFEHLIVLAGDGRKADAAAHVAARLVAAVRIHSIAEERSVYAAMLHGPAQLRSFALAGPHEHENLDTTLEKLLVHPAGDEEYAVIAKVAKDLFEMHAREEEEGEILPLMQSLLPEPELWALATAMLAEEAHVRPQVLRICGMAAHAA
jgi:hypothetical protein